MCLKVTLSETTVDYNLFMFCVLIYILGVGDVG